MYIFRGNEKEIKRKETENAADYHSNSPCPLWKTYLDEVLVVDLIKNVKDLLLAASGEDTVFQGTLPLILNALNLVVCA